MEIKVERKADDENNYYPYDQFVGFTKLDEIEWDNESYQFNITGVWVRDSDGTVWTANDSGCSCPCPWERVDTLERLFSIEPLEERYRAYTFNQDEKNEEYGRYGRTNPDDWFTFKATVEKAFADLAKR